MDIRHIVIVSNIHPGPEVEATVLNQSNSVISNNSTAYRPVVAVLLPFLALLLSSCDLLLGADPKESNVQNYSWDTTVITTGEIAALDASLTSNGEVAVSYIHRGTILRVSLLDGDSWINYDGPSISGPGSTEYTHVAAGPGGIVSVLYSSGADMHIANLGTTLETHVSLSSLDAELIGSSRPDNWYHESANLAYGVDGRIRAIVRDADAERLWLFREEESSWRLQAVPGSESVAGPIDMVVAQSSDEHVVFQTISGGSYRRWNQLNGWEERLRIPDSPPFHIRLRSDESSVLATRYLYSIRVAEEVFNDLEGNYEWQARSVVEDENLFWHNTDLVLDELGLPSLIHIIGPVRNDVFKVWYSRMENDGSWARTLVADNMQHPSFNPFNVRMVRDDSGGIHVILATGEVVGYTGGSPEWEYRLLDIHTSPTPGG